MTKSSREAKEEEQEAVIDQAGEEMKDSNSIEIKKKMDFSLEAIESIREMYSQSCVLQRLF